MLVVAIPPMCSVGVLAWLRFDSPRTALPFAMLAGIWVTGLIVLPEWNWYLGPDPVELLAFVYISALLRFYDCSLFTLFAVTVALPLVRVGREARV